MSKKRLQFDLRQEAYERLENLQKRSGASTKAELVRMALALYDKAISCMENGGSLVLNNPGEKDEIPIFLNKF